MRISDDRILHCCNRRPRTGTGMCPSRASRLDVAHGPPSCLDWFIPVQRIPAPVTEPVPVRIQVPQGGRGPDLSQPAEAAGQFLLSSPETGPGLQDPGLPPVGTRFLVRPPLKPDAAGHISAAVFLIFLDFCVGNIDGGPGTSGRSPGSPARNPPR